MSGTTDIKPHTIEAIWSSKAPVGNYSVFSKHLVEAPASVAETSEIARLNTTKEQSASELAETSAIIFPNGSQSNPYHSKKSPSRRQVLTRSHLGTLSSIGETSCAPPLDMQCGALRPSATHTAKSITRRDALPFGALRRSEASRAPRLMGACASFCCKGLATDAVASA